MSGASGESLVDMENLFFVGSYVTSQNEFYTIRTPSLEKDILMYRAYIAQGRFRIVLDEVQETNDTPLLSMRYLAEYLYVPERKETVLSQIEEKLRGDISEMHVIWTIVGASIYINEEMYETALKLLAGNNNLECLSLYMHCLLKMSRVDLAKQVLQTMQEKDDDAILTQLSQAWLNIQIGGEKLQDAFYIFQDLCDKFSPTLLLLNGQAVCYLGQQKYDDAERVLRECLNRDPNHYDTLVNLLFLTQQKEGNSTQFRRYLTQLLGHKNTTFATMYNKKKSEFERITKQYAPSNTKSISEIIA
ncbi:coatomer subunit epsilon-like [Anopheles albimanus]|uniref:Coatomer subunit epsilon n=1 Tax=Anopheles albimanus TaxID=7167 RepID=A0A182FGE5_ANOAL|nr:coatomer subunit epsilon-like [Anopheles albimanus]